MGLDALVSITRILNVLCFLDGDRKRLRDTGIGFEFPSPTRGTNYQNKNHWLDLSGPGLSACLFVGSLPRLAACYVPSSSTLPVRRCRCFDTLWGVPAKDVVMTTGGGVGV